MRGLAACPTLVLALVLVSGNASSQQTPARAPVEAAVDELWQEPIDLRARDLHAGPGGAALAPPDEPYAFVARKTAGVNPGYDVRDSSGRLWSVKLGEEAQVEVTASRILWAIGFHQPPTYYVPRWTLSGEDAGIKTDARFRIDDHGYRPVGEWSWYENPFVESQAFRGLIVAQMILNNWDLKTSNNRVYEAIDPSDTPRRLFLVRDLGASLGSAKQHRFFAWLGTKGQQGTKNDLEGFEAQGFIDKVEGNRVHFTYRGMNGDLLRIVTPADVVWTCDLLSRLEQQQWAAAFRAGGYPDHKATRYVDKIKAKIAQGLALRAIADAARP